MKRLLLPFVLCLTVLALLARLREQDTVVQSLANGGLDPNVPVYWRSLADFGTTAIAIDPLNPANIYIAATWYDAVAVTRDYGASWTSIPVGDPPGHGIDIAVDSLSPNYAYVSLHNGQIHRSNDYGETWEMVYQNVPSNDPIIDVYVHPITPTLVFGLSYIGTPTVYRSENRGTDWTAIPLVSETTNQSGYQIFSHPTEPNKIYAVTAMGVFVSDNAGLDWTDSGLQARYLAFDPHNGDIIYRVTDIVFQLSKSIDGGTTWTPLPPPQYGGYNEIHLDPSNGNYVYIISPFVDPSRSLDGGQTWQLLDNILPGTANMISQRGAIALAIDPTDSTRVYIGDGFLQLMYLDKSSFLPFTRR